MCLRERERERDMNMNEELFSLDVSPLCLNNACLLRKPDRCILIWSQTQHLQLWLFLCSKAHVIAYLWLLTISQVTFMTRDGFERNQNKLSSLSDRVISITDSVGSCAVIMHSVFIHTVTYSYIHKNEMPRSKC